VKSYSIKVDPNQKFADAGYIWWEGLNQNASDLMKNALQKAFEKKDLSSIPSNPNITPDNYISQVQQKGQDKVAYQAIPAVL